jgi:hypothetical protein
MAHLNNAAGPGGATLGLLASPGRVSAQAQDLADGGPNALRLPALPPSVGRRIIPQLPRHLDPATPRALHVENRLERPAIIGTWAPRPGPGWPEQVLNLCSLGVGHHGGHGLCGAILR